MRAFPIDCIGDGGSSSDDINPGMDGGRVFVRVVGTYTYSGIGFVIIGGRYSVLEIPESRCYTTTNHIADGTGLSTLQPVTSSLGLPELALGTHPVPLWSLILSVG